MHVIIGYADGTLIIHSIHEKNETRLEKLFSMDTLKSHDLHHPMFYAALDSPDIFAFNNEEAIHRFRLHGLPHSAQLDVANKVCLIEHPCLDDDEHMLTLEEQQQIVSENLRIAREDAAKAELSRICLELGNSLNSVKEMNNRLPSKYRVGSAEFEIDLRITNESQRSMDCKLLAMQKEIRAAINEISRHNERIRKALLSSLDHWPFALGGFR